MPLPPCSAMDRRTKAVQQPFERRVEELVDVAWGKTPHAEVHVKLRLM